jgi:hypothetical protein
MGARPMIDLKKIFKVNDSTIVKSDQWVSNGHYMLSVAYIQRLQLNRSKDPLIKKLYGLTTKESGTYKDGIKVREGHGVLSQLVPKDLNNFVTLNINPIGLLTVSGDYSKITAFRYVSSASSDIEVYLSCQYCYIAHLNGIDEVLVKDALTPVVLKSCGEIVGLIMPVRGPK